MSEKDDQRKGVFDAVMEMTGPQIKSLLDDLHYPSDDPEEKKQFDDFKEKLASEMKETLIPQLYVGLIEWAIKKMGEDYTQYLATAFLECLALSDLYRVGTGSDFLEAFEATPLTFPKKLRQSPRLIFTRFDDEYQRLLKQIQKVRKDFKFAGLRRKELKKVLPEAQEANLDQYIGMEPSDVAYDYMVRKLKLPFGPDALKKYIQREKDPMKVAVDFVKDYKRRR